MLEPVPPQTDTVQKEPERAIDPKATVEQAGIDPALVYSDEFNRAAEKPIDLTAAFREACAKAIPAEPAPDPITAFNRAAKEPTSVVQRDRYQGELSYTAGI